jgi:hypothetical protein
VGLVLSDRRTGARRRFASFSDGSFYLMGVKAGDYELALDTAAGRDEAGLTAVPLRFTIEPEVAASGRSGLELVLQPAR